MGPRWRRDGNRIVSADGAAPGAIELWAAEFSDAAESPRPSEVLGDLAFSPSNLALSIRLREANGLVKAVLVGRSDGFEASLSDWPELDYVICQSVWFPVDVAEVAELRALLAPSDLGEPLTTAQLLRINFSDGAKVSPVISPPTGDLQSFNPSIVNASLYDYQVRGATFLSAMADESVGALLADEMGLGKTLQVIYLLAREARARRSPGLVVAPSSLLANWERELSRFAPTLATVRHSGPSRTGDSRDLLKCDVVLTSYDVLVRDVTMFEGRTWNLVVLDEAQSIKNDESKRSIAAKRIMARVPIAVTGTPIENSLTDLWSVMQFVAPSYLGDRRSFERHYPDESAAARDLSTRVSPLVLRREVKDVASDMPPRVDIPVPVEANEVFAHAYERVRESEAPPLAMLMRFRQVCGSPESISGSVGFDTDFPKWSRALEIVEEIRSRNQKVLIFASFRQTMDSIANDLSARYGCFLRVLDGRTSAAERQTAIDEFSELDGFGVLVLNPRAAGVGLNIQAANHVIHFTPEWNPAVVAQATARAFRRGQTLPVFVYFMYFIGTVEEAMIERLEKKRQLQDAGNSSFDDPIEPSDILDAISRSPIKRSPVD